MKTLSSFFPIVIFSFALLFIPNQNEFEQNPDDPQEHFCGHYHMQEAFFAKNPSLKIKQEKLEDQLLQILKNNPQKSNSNYILPIVVHIIHDNGAENISDATVLQGVQDLNDAFANIGYYDQDTGVDTKIQFCLAKQDPNGNATTGINRVENALTEMAARVRIRFL